MTSYTPFEKSFEEIKVDDLQALRSAREGWYLEYKRELPNASTIAKSISSFANTYGGWLFIGVSEKSKEDAVAGSFPGIARDTVDGALQAIRQSVASHVSPSPHFETKVLYGPSEAVGIEDGRAIICILVNWSLTAPHVHKSGQIYRRIADGSEPKPENDRFLLDQLWHRSDKLKEVYKEWVARDPEFSKAEADVPYIRLMLAVDLWDQRDIWAQFTLEEVRKIFGQTSSVVTAVPFDTVHTSSRGFVARQLGANDPHNLGLTWTLRRSLVSDIIIPLRFFSLNSVRETALVLRGYDGAAAFAALLIQAKYSSPRIVDLNFVFNILVGVAELQRRLMDAAKISGDYYVKAKLLNVWRTVPFVDVDRLLSDYSLNGLPMCLDGNVTSPPGTEPGTFLPVDGGGFDEPAARILLEAVGLFRPIAEAFGIPTWLPTQEGRPAYYQELLAAGQKAIDIQNRGKS